MEKARDLVIDITGGKFPVHRLFTPSNQIQQPENLNGIRLGGKDSNPATYPPALDYQGSENPLSPCALFAPIQIILHR
jgi:hypothetical protein